ncbi:MAG TPA: GNAT family N-acetyltransferase, partial [Thermoanaerobaculia bacterium]|nr:GNAT family N-acetyltransferase [Thermoanaerobaculia bacterium]
DVVTIHLAAFPNFFLTFLGPRFLRVFYGAVMRDGIAVVATLNDRVAGFVAGMLDSRSFYRRLWRKRFFHVVFAIAPVVLRHPSTLKRVARRGVARAFQPAPGAELMSLAVHPREQRHGLGRALVDAFVARVHETGTETLWLITDAADNDAVQKFYETLGFTVRRSFTNAEGRALVEYVR